MHRRRRARCALAAVAGNEDWHAGKCATELSELVGVRRADDGPYEAVAAFTAVRESPL